MRNLLQDAKRVAGKVANFFSRGVLESSDDSKQTQILQAELFEGEISSDLDHPEPYGLTARAEDGAEVYVIFQGGDRDNPIVVLCSDKRTRPKNLGKGEVMVWHRSGHKIHLKNDGTIEATTTTFKVVGDIVATGHVSDANGSMQEMRDAYNPHTHGGGSAPSPQMT